MNPIGLFRKSAAKVLNDFRGQLVEEINNMRRVIDNVHQELARFHNDMDQQDWSEIPTDTVGEANETIAQAHRSIADAQKFQDDCRQRLADVDARLKFLRESRSADIEVNMKRLLKMDVVFTPFVRPSKRNRV